MATIIADISITVSEPSQPLTVDASGVPDTAVIGTPYDGALAVSGGTPPYTFAVTSGALPDGLSLDPNAGAITGTPVQDPNETYPFDDSFVITITDSAGAQAQVVKAANRATVIKKK